MSKKTNRPTGLGTSAFFNAGRTNESESAPETPVAEDGEKKMRTTVTLSPEVVAGIEALRTQARKQGNRLTTSQIIEDALRMLMRERKIKV